MEIFTFIYKTLIERKDLRMTSCQPSRLHFASTWLLLTLAWKGWGKIFVEVHELVTKCGWEDGYIQHKQFALHAMYKFCLKQDTRSYLLHLNPEALSVSWNYSYSNHLANYMFHIVWPSWGVVWACIYSASNRVSNSDLGYWEPEYVHGYLSNNFKIAILAL